MRNAQICDTQKAEEEAKRKAAHSNEKPVLNPGAGKI